MGGGREKLFPNEHPDPDGHHGKGRTDGKNLVETWLKEKNSIGKAEYVYNKEDLFALDIKNVDYLMGKIKFFIHVLSNLLIL